MRLLKRIFGKKNPVAEVSNNPLQSRTVEQIQADTDRLWTLLKETVEYYKSLACPCAFPRFFQYTSIDCVETRNSFYMSETEGFIQMARDCFESKEIDKADECYRAIYTCKTCGSTFINGWSDFSIRVNRNYLKPLEVKAVQIGAEAQTPIPFFVGLFGHSYPDRAGFRPVDYDSFKDYIRELKSSSI